MFHEGGNDECEFLARESANLSPILARQWWRHFRLTTSVSLLPSLSLSHRLYLTHNIGSASALPIITGSRPLLSDLDILCEMEHDGPSPLLREAFSVFGLLPSQTYQDTHLVAVECIAQVAAAAHRQTVAVQQPMGLLVVVLQTCTRENGELKIWNNYYQSN